MSLRRFQHVLISKRYPWWCHTWHCLTVLNSWRQLYNSFRRNGKNTRSTVTIVTCIAITVTMLRESKAVPACISKRYSWWCLGTGSLSLILRRNGRSTRSTDYLSDWFCCHSNTYMDLISTIVKQRVRYWMHTNLTAYVHVYVRNGNRMLKESTRINLYMVWEVNRCLKAQ